MSKTDKTAKKAVTMNKIKDDFIVAQEVKDKVKTFNNVKKEVLKSLKNDEKTIPQISEDTGIASGEVT